MSGKRGERGDDEACVKRRGEKSERGERGERGEEGIIGDSGHDGDGGSTGEKARLKNEVLVADNGDCTSSSGGLGAAGNGVSSRTRIRERLTSLRIRREDMYSRASVRCGGSVCEGGAASRGEEMRDFRIAIFAPWSLPSASSL